MELLLSITLYVFVFGIRVNLISLSNWPIPAFFITAGGGLRVR